MTRDKKDKEKPATTAGEEELSGGGEDPGVAFTVGPPAVDGDGTGAQAAGWFDDGDGVVGGVVAGGGSGAEVGTEGEAPGAAAETVMASFWPDWQWVP